VYERADVVVAYVLLCFTAALEFVSACLVLGSGLPMAFTTTMLASTTVLGSGMPKLAGGGATLLLQAVETSQPQPRRSADDGMVAYGRPWDWRQWCWSRPQPV